MTAIRIVQEFAAEVASAGLTPPTEIVPDGVLHRFALNGRPNDLAGWYVLHADGIPAGAFGDWRTGNTHRWHGDIGRRLTREERAAYRQRVEEIRRQREVEETERHEEARQKAKALWDSTDKATDDHSYLKRKGVKAHGLKVHGGRLIVPVTKNGGELHSVQFIEPGGEKKFLTGARVAGGYHVIGTGERAEQDKQICIAEGYATGASIHEATGYTVVVAFNAGNLLFVAQSFHQRFPDWQLIICADDDRGTKGNPGLSKATEAARAVGGLLALPDFSADRPKVATDFNDMASHCGLEAVKAAIKNAQPAEIHSAKAEECEAGKASAQPCETEADLILDPGNPMPAARIFVERFHADQNVRALQHQAGLFFQYLSEANAYTELDEAAVRATLYAFLERAKRWTEPKADKCREPVPFKPTKAKIENVLDALRAVCNLPSDKAAPCWLELCDVNPLDVMACRNGLLHLPTRRLMASTPHFFTTIGLNFSYSPTASRPENWLRFLSELWPHDSQSIGTLQEWMGYLLTPRTHFQKMLMFVGPKRSGKGTIGRVIRMLVGDRNVCGPTLANMGEQFGLSILIGKSAAIVADARISGKTDTAVITERLLSISGEDTLSIPRKFLPDWNGKLPTRFMLMTNELPRIEDASGALASRFIVLMLSESFYGREDHALLDRFIPELPGILLWALDGWNRLNERGRFQQPESAGEMIQQFEDLGSPIGAFIRERCEVGKAHSVTVDRLFQSWKAWCEDNGRERPGTSQAFGRNLRASLPWLKITQPRVSGDRVRYYEGIRLKDEY